jgi:hypothetical protein
LKYLTGETGKGALLEISTNNSTQGKIEGATITAALTHLVGAIGLQKNSRLFSFRDQK